MRTPVVVRRLVPVVFTVVALAKPLAAQETAAPASREEVQQLREEVRSLKEALAAMEARLAAMSLPPAAEAPEPALAQTPTPAPAADLSSLAASAIPAGSSKVFNPDIAVIGDFLGAAGRNPSPDAPPSLELHEAEASFQAIVDPYARADFFLTFGPDEVGVEEGFITFPTVPGGLLLKVGKMRDAFGKVDSMHNHVLPWTDRPLVTQNLTGGEDGLADYGASISRLIPNRVLFLEATAQVYRGESAVFAAQHRGDLAYVGHLRAYRDLGESTNLDLGGSFASGGNDAGPGFRTRLWGADATFRYRPLRRAIYRRLAARTELVWSRRDQEPAAASAFGFYASTEYQFARRWYAGLRYDRSDRAEDPGLTDKGGSAFLSWWPSEFSQIRGQYRHIHFGEDKTADEFLFQFLFSIGAHGAHAF
jgi:hypothetical protein